jgi:hypothetical protein
MYSLRLRRSISILGCQPESRQLCPNCRKAYEPGPFSSGIGARVGSPRAAPLGQVPEIELCVSANGLALPKARRNYLECRGPKALNW